MRDLTYRAEQWLVAKSNEAWAAYLHWKYAQDRDAVSAVLRPEIKELINEAHRRARPNR